MEKINQHIVNRINLEVNTGQEYLAYSLQSRLDTFLNNDLLPKIETLFDRSSSFDQIKRFDSIDIEIDVADIENLADVSDDIIRSLQAKIEAVSFELEKIPNEYQRVTSSIHENKDALRQFKHIEKQFIQKAKSIQSGTNLAEILIRFLETGQIPWYGSPSTLKEYIRSIETSQELIPDYLIVRLREVLRVNSIARNRFFNQMSQAFIERFILRLIALQSIDLPERLVSLPITNSYINKLVIRSVISRLIEPNYLIPEIELSQISKELRIEKQLRSRKDAAMSIVELFKYIHLEFTEASGKVTSASSRLMELVTPENHSEGSQPSSEQVGWKDHENTLKSERDSKTELFEKQTDVEPDDDISFSDFEKQSQVEIYIQNAGLILTHPFLWNFLTHLKCTDGKKQLLPDQTYRAAHLLHFLATGEENDFEFNMAFEKFLCSIPQEMPVIRETYLSADEKQECDNLLRTIIGYWPALKNTSPDGLRQLFFHRNGKLDLQKFPHKLFVERKAQDILLESLEWNISMVKLQWMTELLFVEW